MNLDDALRRAFDAQAELIQPTDALHTIQRRITGTTRIRRRITMGLATVASGTVATVTAVLVGMASCAPPTITPPTQPGASGTPSASAPTTGAPSSSPSPGSTATDQLPVYYLGQASGRTMLYREFRTLTLPSNDLVGRIRAAVTAMMRDDPLDPDYTSLWPSNGTIRDVRVEGAVAVVDLSGVTPNSVGAEGEAMSIEQLVWTVTAVAADASSPVDGVRLLVDGTGGQLWGHVAIGGVLHRRDATAVQAPIWLITPQEGSTVGPNFQVQISGTVFEATAHLRVRNASGSVVVDRSVMLSAGPPARGDAVVNLSLAPGRYTVEAFYYSQRDDSIQALDDHTITVA